MIKRDGVQILTDNKVSSKNKFEKIALETLEILEKKFYSYINKDNKYIINISKSIDNSILNTIHYDNEVPTIDHGNVAPVIEVVNETTAQAGARLLSEGKTNIVALNFAAARNPGGGFLRGASAQEEDLCRCSTLYACLLSKPEYYNNNILCDNSYYTDDILYSPNVLFFRDQFNLFLEKPFELSIISSPAPNVSVMDSEEVNEYELYSTLRNRILKILQVAEYHGHKNILLGAWGTGAFGNDAKMVASIFLDVLQEVPSFEHVCFPVYDVRPDTPTFNIFKRILIS